MGSLLVHYVDGVSPPARLQLGKTLRVEVPIMLDKPPGPDSPRAAFQLTLGEDGERLTILPDAVVLPARAPVALASAAESLVRRAMREGQRIVVEESDLRELEEALHPLVEVSSDERVAAFEEVADFIDQLVLGPVPGRSIALIADLVRRRGRYQSPK